MTKRKVLLIDDNKLLVDAACAVLNKNNFNAKGVYSEAEFGDSLNQECDILVINENLFDHLDINSLIKKPLIVVQDNDDSKSSFSKKIFKDLNTTNENISYIRRDVLHERLIPLLNMSAF